MIQTISLAVKDGSSMNAHVAMPEGDGVFPAVIVLQEAFGVNHHIRDVTERIAKEGYVAIAPELFHRTAPAGFEGSYKDFSQVAPHVQAVTPESAAADLEAVYQWLQAQKQVQTELVASIGFCMGGRVSFIANSLLPIKAAISFYGSGIQNLLDRVPHLNAPMLFFWGGQDQHIRPEHIRSVIDGLREGKKPYTNVEISYADHGFFCNEREAYHPEAAAEAWSLVTVFLRERLKTAGS